jgi:hypothetical protein
VTGFLDADDAVTAADISSFPFASAMSICVGIVVEQGWSFLFSHSPCFSLSLKGDWASRKVKDIIII